MDGFKMQNNEFWRHYLGDNCIQICHLGRYIVGYTVENFVLRRRVMISDRISDDIPPKMTNWNMVFLILMSFFTFTSKQGIYLKKVSCMSDVYSLR